VVVSGFRSPHLLFLLILLDELNEYCLILLVNTVAFEALQVFSNELPVCVYLLAALANGFLADGSMSSSVDSAQPACHCLSPSREGVPFPSSLMS
jgi:hypothetical protein